MTSASQNILNFPTGKKMLLDTREDAYNKQKDMRKHIEIRVSELLDKEESHQEEEHLPEDSFFQKNNINHPNVSVKILEEYQLRHAPKQSIGASRSREKIKSSSSVGAIVSEQADHRVGDMFKWKERVHKKHEMKREFQEQIRSSMYDYKVYTNDLSNQMLETIRPNAKVENILLLKGQAKQMKIKQIEQQLYGGHRVPSITKMAQRLNSSQTVYNRLYDVDKHRRDKSREALLKNQSQIQNQTLDSIHTRNRSKSEGKRKTVLSAFMSPQRGNTQNFDFHFSASEVMSPIAVNQTVDTQLLRDTLSLQQTAVTSPTGGMSPLYSVKNANNAKAMLIQQSLNKSSEEIFSLQTSPVNHRKAAERPRTGGMSSIYKRLTPAPKNNTATARSFQQGTSHSRQQKSFTNLGESNSQLQFLNQEQPEKVEKVEKVKRSGGMSPSESTPVLPNMIFFKNSGDRQGALTPTQVNRKIQHRKNPSKGYEKKDTFDIKSMEMFWEKILQDDSEGRGKKYDDHDGQAKFSVADRNKMWVEKKNKKLEDQRKQKEEKELENCTFKPQLQYQDQPNKNMQMYFNFLERIAQTKTTPSTSTTASPLYPPQSYQALKNSGLTIQTGSNQEMGSHSDSHENEGNARYTVDANVQKKIYNYILNIPN